MSKAHDPHWRYIAVRIEAAASLSRKGLNQALSRHFRKLNWPQSEAPQLTRFEWPHAIVKVHHFRLADARKALAEMTTAVEAAAPVSIRVETLSSSGTILTLTTRLGILAKRT